MSTIDTSRRRQSAQTMKKSDPATTQHSCSSKGPSRANQPDNIDLLGRVANVLVTMYAVYLYSLHVRMLEEQFATNDL